jgi:hypothetical protein
MAHAGSIDADLPEEELPGSKSAPLECDEPARPDSRLYKKVTAFNAFIDESAKGLTPSTTLVWLTLFRFARDGVAMVSKATVAQRLGIDEKTVTRSIKTLRRLGLLKIDYQGGVGRGCNRYSLGITTLEKANKRSRKKAPAEDSGTPAESPDINNITAS